MRKLIPILLALIGLGVGGGAGYFLRPAPEETLAANPCGEGPAPTEHDEEAPAEGEPTVEYVKLNNQFVIPVVENGQVTALVILSLSMEVKVGATEKVYAAEPKLRDNLLQVLFNHANVGGFKGAFTDEANMETLRKALLEASQSVLGDVVTGVLVSDIVRQDTK
jgi:hypothetical protein